MGAPPRPVGRNEDISPQPNLEAYGVGDVHPHEPRRIQPKRPLRPKHARRLGETGRRATELAADGFLETCYEAELLDAGAPALACVGDDDAVASLEEQLHPDNDPQRLKAALRALGRSHTAGSDELLWAQARRPAEEEPLHETVVTTLTAKPFPLQRTPLLGALDQGKKPGLKNALPILTEGAPTGTVSVENLEQVK